MYEHVLGVHLTLQCSINGCYSRVDFQGIFRGNFLICLSHS